MKVVIDRFEGMFAICEDENKAVISIEKCKLPPDAKEGDVLIIEDSGIAIDAESTRTRKEAIHEIMKGIWE